MKKFIAFLLATITVFGLFGAVSFADTEIETGDMTSGIKVKELSNGKMAIYMPKVTSETTLTEDFVDITTEYKYDEIALGLNTNKKNASVTLSKSNTNPDKILLIGKKAGKGSVYVGKYAYDYRKSGSTLNCSIRQMYRFDYIVTADLKVKYAGGEFLNDDFSEIESMMWADHVAYSPISYYFAEYKLCALNDAGYITYKNKWEYDGCTREYFEAEVAKKIYGLELSAKFNGTSSVISTSPFIPELPGDYLLLIKTIFGKKDTVEITLNQNNTIKTGIKENAVTSGNFAIIARTFVAKASVNGSTVSISPFTNGKVSMIIYVKSKSGHKSAYTFDVTVTSRKNLNISNIKYYYGGRIYDMSNLLYSAQSTTSNARYDCYEDCHTNSNERYTAAQFIALLSEYGIAE